MTENINSLWIGNSLSNLEILSIKSHLQQRHEYHLWVYEDIKNIPEGVIIEDGNKILPESEIFSYKVGEGKGSVSAFSNLFRYKLLWELGGWWCDTDVIALKSFDFKEDLVFASERRRDMSSLPTTCVIKMPSKCHIANDCFKFAKSQNRETLQWSMIGPKLLSKVIFESYGCIEYVVSPDHFCPVNWFDSECDPVVHNSPNISNSYAVHMWHEMWRRRGIDKNGSYADDCLFERLKNAILSKR